MSNRKLCEHNNTNNDHGYHLPTAYHKGRKALDAEKIQPYETSESLKLSSEHSIASIFMDDIDKEMKHFQRNSERKKAAQIPKEAFNKIGMIDSEIMPLVRDKSGTLNTNTREKIEALAPAYTSQPRAKNATVCCNRGQKTRHGGPPLVHSKPSEYLHSILEGISIATLASDCYWKDYFASAENAMSIQEDSFPSKVNKVLRTDDVEYLKKLQQKGLLADLEAYTKHGERLISLACREGSANIVRYLIRDAKVSVRVRDNSGKTPLHEVCWFTHPPQFDIVSLLLSDAPELLFARDERGFTALDYIPQKCRKEWCQYIKRKQSFIRTMVQLALCRQGLLRLHINQQRLLQGMIEEVSRLDF